MVIVVTGTDQMWSTESSYEKNGKWVVFFDPSQPCVHYHYSNRCKMEHHSVVFFPSVDATTSPWATSSWKDPWDGIASKVCFRVSWFFLVSYEREIPFIVARFVGYSKQPAHKHTHTPPPPCLESHRYTLGTWAPVSSTCVGLLPFWTVPLIWCRPLKDANARRWWRWWWGCTIITPLSGAAGVKAHRSPEGARMNVYNFAPLSNPSE